jgi:hypothetical protein
MGVELGQDGTGARGAAERGSLVEQGACATGGVPDVGWSGSV